MTAAEAAPLVLLVCLLLSALGVWALSRATRDPRERR